MTKEEAIAIITRWLACGTYRKTKETYGYLEGWFRDSDEEAFNMAIKALEQTCWIPVSERLPEYMVPVLTWDGNIFCVEKRIPCIRDDDGEIIEGNWWVSDDYDESNSKYYPNLRDGACVAWMPIPLYKVESEDE